MFPLSPPPPFSDISSATLIETIAQNKFPQTYNTVALNRADRRNNQTALPQSLQRRRIGLCPQRRVWSAAYSQLLLLLLIDFVDCVPMDYQTLGTIGASMFHTTDVPSQKPCSGERLESSPLLTSQILTGLDLISQQVPWYKISGIRLCISPQRVPMVRLRLSPQRGLDYSRATNLGIYSQSPQVSSILNAADLPAPKVVQDIVRHDLPQTNSCRCQIKHLGPIIAFSFQTGPS